MEPKAALSYGLQSVIFSNPARNAPDWRKEFFFAAAEYTSRHHVFDLTGLIQEKKL